MKADSGKLVAKISVVVESGRGKRKEKKILFEIGEFEVGEEAWSADYAFQHFAPQLERAAQDIETSIKIRDDYEQARRRIRYSIALSSPSGRKQKCTRMHKTVHRDLFEKY